MPTATWQLRSHRRGPAVGVGAPAGELATGVDDHAARAGGEQAAVDHVSHRHGVVHRRALHP